MKDTFFTSENWDGNRFSFNAPVVSVFDDMITRSVPHYKEIQAMICELAGAFASPHSHVYDLGCSTGTTLLNLDTYLSPSISIEGVDYSQDMLDKAAHKLKEKAVSRTILLTQADLSHPFEFKPTSFVILNLCLQFIDKDKRASLLTDIYNALTPGGALCLIEKTQSDHSALSSLYEHIYFNYKRKNGYSEHEIQNKKEALKNVLNPLSFGNNISMLHHSGFSSVEPFFNWYNFTGLVAIK